MGKPKPRLYYKYYPASRRGYWLVSRMPKPFVYGLNSIWNDAHNIARRMNLEIQNRLEYRREFVKQYHLRITT